MATESLLDLLAARASMPLSMARRIVATASRRYRDYEIPKRKGGFRLISQPSAKVKQLQRAMLAYLAPLLDVDQAATAYRSGLGLSANVQPHRNGRYLLKTDFQDFFPSIRAADLARVLDRKHMLLAEEDRWVVLALAFRRNPGEAEGHLAIGAPTSPLISNAVMREFDSRLRSWCEAKQVTYTRYADDMTFSCSAPGVLRTVEKKLAALLARMTSPTLALHTRKTVHASIKSGRRVTGLVITNAAQTGVGRTRRRELRAGLCAYARGSLDPEAQRRLQGWLAHIQSVDAGGLAWLRAHDPDAVARLLAQTWDQ